MEPPPVRNQFAEEHELFGEEIVMTLSMVNRTTNRPTKFYLVELMDEDDNRKIVKAFGLDSITRNLPTINYGNLKNKFSPQVQEMWTSLVIRSSGVVVDLPMGGEVINLHPVRLETQGNMMARRSRFGVG